MGEVSEVSVLEAYKAWCGDLPWERSVSVSSWDDSTFFCPAGMQRYKPWFRDRSFFGKTVAGFQRCLRVGDIGEIGDGVHLGVFDMLGLFSFRDWSLSDAVGFWTGFVQSLGLEIERATVHPDMIGWSVLHSVPVEEDDGCVWSDGEIGGYCTEFYVGGVEVGNIVVPNGDCIDAGFGLDRLQSLVDGTPLPGRAECLVRMAEEIVKSGVKPSSSGAGYVLRSVVRAMLKEGVEWDSEIMRSESDRFDRNKARYESLLPRNRDKSPEWWWETHGIEV